MNPIETNMTEPVNEKTDRRGFLKTSTIALAGAGALGIGAGSCWLGSVNRVSKSHGKKVIIIGIDGMDPQLSENMMREGLLPNLAKLRASGGFSSLGTSMPPQSPVAWANFINGAGPGSHGIFDFVHRHPEHQCDPFYSAAETVPGDGYWEVGDHRLPLDFWPFNHKKETTVLKRQGTPFWDYLDAQGIPTTFYDLPSNYPPSPSNHGHHRCICGMGTPDLTGGYGTYQFFGEEVPEDKTTELGGKRTKVTFESETARTVLVGPKNSLLKDPKDVEVELLFHRDKQANAAVIEVQGKRIVLKRGQWSKWIPIEFEITMPRLIPNDSVRGICRFYLQEVAPNFRLYVTPINVDPTDPAIQLSEPSTFIHDVSKRLGLFYTTGFKEDHRARTNNIFVDEEYIQQANMVLEERLSLFEYAIQNYDDGLLYFYFSSSDLQSHIMWWNTDDKHPTRSEEEAKKYFGQIKRLYQRLDSILGDLHDRYGSSATIIVMSDHGFANFGRQFNLNTWLRDNDYIGPSGCHSLTGNDIDWSQTKAYGLGINGLYLNLRGRERDGIVEPGAEQEKLLAKLIKDLEAVEDDDQRVIRKVYRADKIYSGNATALAPDLIIGYARGYRASWDTSLGIITEDAVSLNEEAWSADHCMDALEVPGVLWSNCPIHGKNPSLVDIAPSILAMYGLPIPGDMTGKNVFSS
jgi:predicted AlkP superfamily phosphohydrolase/phosphomutase